MAVASQCKVSGDGLTSAMARQAASFTIEACDAHGQRLAVGGERFTVALHGMSVVHVTVSDNEDGTYTCQFRASVSGAYRLSIQLHGVALPGSPFALTVLRPKPCPSKCVLSGPGLSQAATREITYLDIEFRDALGQLTHSEDIDVWMELVASTPFRTRPSDDQLQAYLTHLAGADTWRLPSDGGQPLSAELLSSLDGPPHPFWLRSPPASPVRVKAARTIQRFSRGRRVRVWQHEAAAEHAALAAAAVSTDQDLSSAASIPPSPAGTHADGSQLATTTDTTDAALARASSSNPFWAAMVRKLTRQPSLSTGDENGAADLPTSNSVSMPAVAVGVKWGSSTSLHADAAGPTVTSSMPQRDSPSKLAASSVGGAASSAEGTAASNNPDSGTPATSFTQKPAKLKGRERSSSPSRSRLITKSAKQKEREEKAKAEQAIKEQEAMARAEAEAEAAKKQAEEEAAAAAAAVAAAAALVAEHRRVAAELKAKMHKERTRPQLREDCRSHGLEDTGPKKVLVDRLVLHLHPPLPPDATSATMDDEGKTQPGGGSSSNGKGILSESSGGRPSSGKQVGHDEAQLQAESTMMAADGWAAPQHSDGTDLPPASRRSARGSARGVDDGNRRLESTRSFGQASSRYYGSPRQRGGIVRLGASERAHHRWMWYVRHGGAVASAESRSRDDESPLAGDQLHDAQSPGVPPPSHRAALRPSQGVASGYVGAIEQSNRGLQSSRSGSPRRAKRDAFDAEVQEDPEGIGFALDSLYPGRIHAHGKVVPSHRVRFSVGRSGVFRLYVGSRPQSKLLPGAPFIVNVLPGQASPRWTRLDSGVPGVYSSSSLSASSQDDLPHNGAVVLHAMAGETREERRGPTVITCDISGNRCITGGARVRIECDRPEMRARTVDEDDGTYAIWWMPPVRTGTYRLQVTLDGTQVVNGAMVVIVSAAHPDPSRFVLHGQGLSALGVGEKVHLRIAGYDVCGNPISLSSSGMEFGLALVRPMSDAARKRRDRGRRLTKSGSAPFIEPEPEPVAASVESTQVLHMGRLRGASGVMLSGALTDKPIEQRCFLAWKSLIKKRNLVVGQVEVEGEYSAARFEECDGLRGAKSLAYHGTWRKPPRSMPEADGASQLSHDLSKVGPIEELEIAYTTKLAGQHELHVWVEPAARDKRRERTALPGSPFTVHVKEAEAVASKCIVDATRQLLEGSREMLSDSREILKLSVQTFDRYGNHTASGVDDHLVALVSRSDWEWEQEEWEVGTHVALGARTLPTGEQSRVRRFSASSCRSELSCTSERTSSHRSELPTSPLGRVSPVNGVGEEMLATDTEGVGSFEGSGTAVDPGMPFTYHVLFLQPQADGNKGVYHTSFMPESLHPMAVGEYKISILLRREEVDGSPLRYKVLPSGPYAPNCVLIPPKVAYVHAVGSRPVEVELKTFDRWHNACIDGGASVKALGRLQLQDLMRRELPLPKDNLDGTYTIYVEQRTPGMMEIMAQVNNLQVPKTIFEFMMLAATITGEASGDGSEDEQPRVR